MVQVNRGAISKVNKMEFNTTLDDLEVQVKVIIEEFEPYDPRNGNLGYVNYSVYLLDSNEEITDDLDGQERIQIEDEAYEYAVDHLGSTDDEEELNFE